MAEVVIFEYAKIDNFAFNNQYGMYTSGVPSYAVFEIGKSYTVVWDDVEYTCVGQDMSALVEGAVSVGNLSAFGGIGNDEPFVIASAAGGFLFGSFDTKTEHWVGIVTEIHAPNDVVIQNYSQTEVPYTNVPKVWLKSPNSTPNNLVLVPFSYGEAIENVPISLDFSAGDQRVTAEDGYLVKSAVIEKPGDLAAENVRRGKVIAGVEGDFVGDTEEITVDGDNDLTFAGGDFVVEPSSAEKVISKVTISPPSALVPANIAKGVTIAGVEGTHEGGGGGGGGDIVAEKDVKFFDYDGTLLHEYTIAEANALSELPALPTHDGLICQGWNYSLEDVKNTKIPVNIGATYITDDGKTRVYIEYDSGNAAALTYHWSQSITNGVLIDWGDGSDIVSVSGTGSVTATHTYQSTGNYVATFSVVDGCTFTLGHGYNDRVFCGASSVDKAFVRSINIGGGSVAFSNYALYGAHQLTSITIPNGITSIGNYVFYSSSSLKSITIPSTVTSIGKLAFRECVSLENVSIPYGITSIAEEAFNNCYSLTSIRIPDSVTNIEKNAFKSCYTLTSIHIPGSVISIGDTAFNGCYGLTSVNISEGATSIGASTFSYCRKLKSVTIPSTLTSMGTYAFSYCYGLTSVNISEGATSIGDSAFRYCYGLKSVTIPSTLTSMGTYAFDNCNGLTSVDISEGVISIGRYAFNSCSALASIRIPGSVTSIGNSAFSGCSGLTSVDISEGVISIEDHAFSSCSKLKSVTIPSTVTSIGNSAFYYCYSLTSVNILGSVTSIGKSAFSSCYSLKNVYMSDGITSIGGSAFGLAYCLSDINIPSTVTDIGNSAFSGCYGLTTFDFSHFTAIPTLGGTSAFYKSNWLTIKIPSALLSSWKAASNWSSYSRYMVGV